MKKSIFYFGLFCAMLLGLSSCDNTATNKEVTADDLHTGADSLSYAYGIWSGEGMYKQGLDIDPELFTAGMKKTVSGEEGLMSAQEAGEVLKNYFEKKKPQQEEMASLAEAKENKQMGAIFLSENAKREGVKVTDSGLQYEVLKSGNGKTPTNADKVSVHYTGRLIDGSVFDSSVERGQPAEFGVTQVIRGWTEALLMMKEGDKWKVAIPSDLAYGDAGRPSIPPGATLVFEIELLKVL